MRHVTQRRHTKLGWSSSLASFLLTGAKSGAPPYLRKGKSSETSGLFRQGSGIQSLSKEVRFLVVRTSRVGNREIPIWARSTAGLSLEEAAKAIGLKDAYGKTATERLAELENRIGEPSRPLLLRMSKAYRRSLLPFYLAGPRATGDRGDDFRRLPGAEPPLSNGLRTKTDNRSALARVAGAPGYRSGRSEATDWSRETLSRNVAVGMKNKLPVTAVLKSRMRS